mmetsp:Transcript_30632/g.49284  ORF Transcript_30632/g.49284 Transcript_30632/m.49284 type:complete len:85 (+) Transcript_30632:1002-1256(+)
MRRFPSQTLAYLWQTLVINALSLLTWISCLNTWARQIPVLHRAKGDGFEQRRTSLTQTFLGMCVGLQMAKPFGSCDNGGRLRAE